MLRQARESQHKGHREDEKKSPEAVIEVITGVVRRLCKEVDHKELNLVYKCLFKKISVCISDGWLVHLGRLLSLLTSTVRLGYQSNVFVCSSTSVCVHEDSQRMFELVRLLIHTFVVPADNKKSEDKSVEVLNRILQLILCLLDVPLISSDLSSISVLYAPVFSLKNSSLLMFMKGLLSKDPHIANTFRSHIIISMMNNLVEDSPEEIILLMLKFFEGQMKLQPCNILEGVSEDKVVKICTFFTVTLSDWSVMMEEIATSSGLSDIQVNTSKLSLIWGSLKCYSHFQHQQDKLSLMKNQICSFDNLLEREAGSSKRGALEIK